MYMPGVSRFCILHSRAAKVAGNGSQAMTLPLLETSLAACAAKTPMFAPTSTTMPPLGRKMPCCK